jgi:glycosyltransferase involved in cell wall biosynthesis
MIAFCTIGLDKKERIVMRIGMMADIYKPHISGVTNYIALNKKYLEQLGHQVYVFTFKDQNYQDEEENIIRSRGIPISDKGITINLRYSKEARTLLQTMDIVHVHHPFISGSLALSYCRRRGIPVVFTNHTRYDLYAQAYLPAVADAISETAIEAFLPTFCRSVDLVVAPSEGLKKVLANLGVDAQIVVVPNGVDLKPFQKVQERQDRAAFGIGPQDIILAFVGRLGPEKNLSFLLRSFAGAFQAYDHIYLFLIGEGPERENLQDSVKYMGIADRVRFTGLIPYDQLPSYLAMADGFVTASVTEVHPLSVIEAMAAGLPVVGIQSPGVGDTIVDGETGFLARDEDLAAYTAKLVRMITDQEKRIEMGKQAKLAVEKYSIDRTVIEILEYYRKVLQSSKGRKRSLRSRLNRVLDRWMG